MDRYRIALPYGRWLAVSKAQLERITRGLGEQGDGEARDDLEPAIIAALLAMPPTQRSDALTVAMLRFGDKQDVETIAHTSGLSPWQVWQLEEAFRRALDEVRAQRARAPRPRLIPQLAH